MNKDTEFTCVFMGGQSGSLNKSDIDNTLGEKLIIFFTKEKVFFLYDFVINQNKTIKPGEPYVKSYRICFE